MKQRDEPSGDRNRRIFQWNWIPFWRNPMLIQPSDFDSDRPTNKKVGSTLPIGLENNFIRGMPKKPEILEGPNLFLFHLCFV